MGTLPWWAWPADGRFRRHSPPRRDLPERLTLAYVVAQLLFMILKMALARGVFSRLIVSRFR